MSKRVAKGEQYCKVVLEIPLIATRTTSNDEVDFYIQHYLEEQLASAVKWLSTQAEIGPLRLANSFNHHVE